jgi:hypothetical protein
MIKTNDIRVGNWLSTMDNAWGKVKSIQETILINHALETRGYLPEQLFPIEMSLHILPLCGFQPHDAGYIHKESFLQLRYFGNEGCAILIINEVKRFAFVHQLQNLYYDATGQLLDPNLYGN